MHLQLCKKEAIAIVGKGLIMLKIQSLENPPKKLHIFLAEFQIFIFFTTLSFILLLFSMGFQ
jgi:hypothetical protein